MKKVLDIVVTLCTLGAAVFLALMIGPQFLKLQGGAKALGQKEFAEAEGSYISYEAAYPVASWVEEYYSGDPDRVRETGYVVYDEGRQEFIYVVVSDRDNRDFSSLMRDLHMVSEMRDDDDMTPVPVKGTLKALEESDVKQILRALEESETVSLYGGFQEGDEYFETYYGDKYGRVMLKMCQELKQGGQSDWYVLENKKIDGMELYEIWIAFLAMALSFLIFISRVVILLKGDKKKAQKELPESADKLERLLEAQRGWLTEWCGYCQNRGRKQIYITVIGSVVILGAIGLWVNPDLQRTLTFHIPLGLLFGETIAVLFWLAQRGRSTPDKLMKKMRKNLDKAFPSSGERDRFAEDILAAGPEWDFQERKKESMIHGTVGSRYWVFFFGTSMVTVVDSDRVGEMEAEHITGQIRSGKARVRYEYFVVRFFDRNSDPKKSWDKEISFETEDGRGDFMILARRRKGDEIKMR